MTPHVDYGIFLYIPNIIGYIRILMIGVAWCYYQDSPWRFMFLYCSSTALDAVDGMAARNFHQTSAFGAWFDVVIDVFARGMLWSKIHHAAYLISAVEWLCFVCTHTLGAQWKTAFINEPWFVQKVMAKNFKTEWGASAIMGIHVLPIWMYAFSVGLFDQLYLPRVLQHLSILVLVAGRLLGMAVEIWCIYAHVLFLVATQNLNINGSIPSAPNSPEEHRRKSQSPDAD